MRVQAQGAEVTVGHLRTRNGDHEVDLVVVRDEGSSSTPGLMHIDASTASGLLRWAISGPERRPG